jgi:hypothetical protein
MTTPPPTGAPVNVLVVDDESNIRKTLSICLEAEGHHVTAVPPDVPPGVRRSPPGHGERP